VILLLDHQDSFVHTLAGYIARLGAPARVIRDDAIDLAVVIALAPAGVVLSPGPCRPADCPVARDVVRALGGATPILGVCLGHQVIATALGGHVELAAHPRHGMTSPIVHDGVGIFAGLPSPMTATRYHSLAVVEASLPEALVVSARADDGEVMGIRHRTQPIDGVQFHPESVATEQGFALIRNWVARVENRGSPPTTPAGLR
jgi:anthranilate synthase/aminodeoxychorismate synthase-like glutamine amidotransferase